MIDNELIIHIGYHKTGSTFLQEKVFPKMGFDQVMLPMNTISLKRDFDPRLALAKALITRSVKGRDSVNNWNGDRIIISQESLSGHKDGNPGWNPYTIAQNLKLTFPNGKIMIVVREQFDYILSLYAFLVYIKGCERRSLSKYLHDNHKLDFGLVEKLQYDKLIDHYQRLFGKDNVLVMLYEQLKENELYFIDSVSDFIGYKRGIHISSTKVNASTRNLYSLTMSRFINYPFSIGLDTLIRCGVLPAIRPHSSRYDRFLFLLRKEIINPLLDILVSKTEKKIGINPEWRDFLSPIFAESNHRLAKITDINLAKYGYAW
jgi:hypothetical protein